MYAGLIDFCSVNTDNTGTDILPAAVMLIRMGFSLK